MRNDEKILKAFRCDDLIYQLLLLPTADPNVHLDQCTNFDHARLDQRFEVVDEEIASVCSKFAKSEFHVFSIKAIKAIKRHL